MKLTTLLEWRNKAGLSQKEAGEAIGISQPVYARLETKQREPTALMAIRIEQKTGISRKVLRPDIFAVKPKARQ